MLSQVTKEKEETGGVSIYNSIEIYVQSEREREREGVVEKERHIGVSLGLVCDVCLDGPRTGEGGTVENVGCFSIDLTTVKNGLSRYFDQQVGSVFYHCT